MQFIFMYRICYFEIEYFKMIDHLLLCHIQVKVENQGQPAAFIMHSIQMLLCNLTFMTPERIIIDFSSGIRLIL